jgi:hypothetical protein
MFGYRPAMKVELYIKSFDILATCSNNVLKHGDFEEIFLISEIFKREFLTEYYIFEKVFRQTENIRPKLKCWSHMIFFKYYLVTASKKICRLIRGMVFTYVLKNI